MQASISAAPRPEIMLGSGRPARRRPDPADGFLAHPRGGDGWGGARRSGEGARARRRPRRPPASARWWSEPMAATPTSNASNSRRACAPPARQGAGRQRCRADGRPPRAISAASASWRAPARSRSRARPMARMLAAGGWGWILGDEGSAPALVRDAAKAIRGAIDAGDGADPLTDALMRELGTDDPTMLGRLLNDTRSAVIWGRYANAVFAAADAGSPPGASASSSKVVRRWRRWWASHQARRRCRRASSPAAASSSSSPG